MSQKNILFLIIPVFILIVAWIIFNIYHNTAASTISDKLNIQIFPIAPNFDAKTINKIKDRRTVTPLYELSPVENSASPTPTLLPEKISTESGSATPGGNLLP